MSSLKQKFLKFVRYVKNRYRLHQYFRAAKKNQINAHWDDKLVGFKYSRETTYSSNWNKITLAARGVTFDSVTGEIVARPFRKFFNFGELVTVEGINTTLCKKLPKEYLPNLNGHFRVMDKLDGFLAITFFNPYTQKWQIKTSGSFHADQSNWAQSWFDEHVCSDKMKTGNTYLFEGIWEGDKHVVKYDFNELRLLAVIPNETGIEVPLDEIIKTADELGVKMAEVKSYNDFNEMVKDVSNYPATLEGVVVTFDNGYKCKVKGNEYCEMFKILNNLTEREVYMRYDPVKDIVYANVNPANGYKPINDEELVIPEELPEIADYVNDLKKRHRELFNVVLGISKDVMKLELSGKELYDEVCRRCTGKKEFIGPIMSTIKSLQKGDTQFFMAKTALKKLLR